MTTVYPINVINPNATYNAVKVQINDPKTIIPEGYKGSAEELGAFNAANIEINRPTVEVKKDTTYDYPEAYEIVTFDQAQILPIAVPALPAEKVEGIENLSVNAPEPNLTTVEAEKKNLV